jgi:hypothetical protein
MTLVEAMRCALALRAGGDLTFIPVEYEERLFVDEGPYEAVDSQPTSIGRVNMGGTNYVAEALGTSGATLEQVELIGQQCKWDRLQASHMPCSEDASFLLTKPNGKTLPLCAKHAEELRRQHDSSSAVAPREDGSYGWPVLPISFADTSEATSDLSPVEPPAEVSSPTFESSAFSSGESGGAGAGASIDETPVLESTPIEIPQVEVPDVSSSFDSSSSIDTGSGSDTN